MESEAMDTQNGPVAPKRPRDVPSTPDAASPQSRASPRSAKRPRTSSLGLRSRTIHATQPENTQSPPAEHKNNAENNNNGNDQSAASGNASSSNVSHAHATNSHPTLEATPATPLPDTHPDRDSRPETPPSADSPDAISSPEASDSDILSDDSRRQQSQSPHRSRSPIGFDSPSARSSSHVRTVHPGLTRSASQEVYTDQAPLHDAPTIRDPHTSQVFHEGEHVFGQRLDGIGAIILNSTFQVATERRQERAERMALRQQQAEAQNDKADQISISEGFDGDQMNSAHIEQDIPFHDFDAPEDSAIRDEERYILPKIDPARLSIGPFDDVDFVAFRVRNIHPDFKDDKDVNDALREAASWASLDAEDKNRILTDVYFYTRGNPYSVIKAIRSDDGDVYRLVQHPILQISRSAREELLHDFYRENCFTASVDLGLGEFDESNLSRGLRILGRDLTAALFRSSRFDDSPSLTITFANFHAATIDGILQWVRMSLDGPMAPSRLESHTDPGHDHPSANWVFDADPPPSPKDRRILQLLMRSLQSLAITIGSRPRASRGDVKREVINWLADYQIIGDNHAVQNPADRVAEAKFRLGELTGHRFKRMAK